MPTPRPPRWLSRLVRRRRVPSGRLSEPVPVLPVLAAADVPEYFLRISEILKEWEPGKPGPDDADMAEYTRIFRVQGLNAAANARDAYHELVEHNRRYYEVYATSRARLDELFELIATQRNEPADSEKQAALERGKAFDRWEESCSAEHDADSRRRSVAATLTRELVAVLGAGIDLVGALQDAARPLPARGETTKMRLLRVMRARDVYHELVEHNRLYHEAGASGDDGAKDDADRRRREVAVRLADELKTMLHATTDRAHALHDALDEDYTFDEGLA